METENNVNVNTTETNAVITGAGVEAPVGATKTETPAVKTFTQEQIDEIINKKYAQWIKKSEQQAEEKAKEVEEAEKLKRMSEAERQQAEMKKQLDEFNKMKAEMKREKLLNQVTKELATRKLPVAFAEYVMTDDSETTLERLKVFEEQYKGEVKRDVEIQVAERFKGKTPATSTTTQSSNKSFTMEEIKNMSPAEINANWEVISKLKFK